MKAVFVEQPGGPENLKYAELPKPAPGPGQALIKIAAAGVNFIDVYFRTGLYKADPPVVLGNEAAGTVEAVGPDVTEIKPGDLAPVIPDKQPVILHPPLPGEIKAVEAKAPEAKPAQENSKENCV